MGDPSNWSEEPSFQAQLPLALVPYQPQWRRHIDLSDSSSSVELREAFGTAVLDFAVVTAEKPVFRYDDDQDEADLEAYLCYQRAREAFRPTKTESDADIHCPLTGEHEMRVLQLYPGKFDEELCSKLHVCSVDIEYPTRVGTEKTLKSIYPNAKPVGSQYRHWTETNYAISIATGEPIWYTALSYVWGSSALLKPIICNGRPWQTTHNLDLALRYLRQTDVSVMLWVDQICINQDDLKEKSQQVSLMGTIYRWAWSTLVWLGEEADNSIDALRMIVNVPSAFLFQLDERLPDLESFDRLGLPSPDSQQWLYLRKFLSRPWFYRAWIIQEVVISARVHLQCGRKLISWHDITMFTDIMVKFDLTQFLFPANIHTDKLCETGITRIEMIDNFQSLFDGETDKHILEPLVSLVIARGAQATDARDKVFAMIGMIRRAINPDYTKTVFEVYSEAARSILQYCFDDLSHSIDLEQSAPRYVGYSKKSRKRMQFTLYRLLCCVDHEEPTAYYPSWVPDWSTPRQTFSLGLDTIYSNVYHAAGDLGEEDLQLKRIGDKLSMVGIIFDSVSTIGSLASTCLKHLLDMRSATAQFVIKSIRMAIEHCHPYPSNSGLFDAFWKTLVAGKDDTGRLKAPSEFADVFGLLLDSASGASPSMPGQPIPKRRLTLKNLKTRRPGRIYRQIQIAFEAAVTGRILGTTSKQYIGLLPRGTKLGDQICVFLGAHVPFIIRHHEKGDSYQLIGECYVHGIMEGEVMLMEDLKKVEIQLI